MKNSHSPHDFSRPKTGARAKARKEQVPDEDQLATLQIEILDPTPSGSQLSASALPQALEDLAPACIYASLDEMGMAVIHRDGAPICLRRHRITMVIQASRLDTALGTVHDYANTVLEGHPVTWTINQAWCMA